MAIRSKNKLHFINGVLPRPPDHDFNSIDWDRCNTMIMSRIKNSVDLEIAQSILWMDNAVDMWNELKERFYQGDVFHISDLHDEICSLKQGDTSISSYYTKLKILWQELNNFRPIPICNCEASCSVITKIHAYKDSDQVIRFLKGLNDQYAAIRSHIMLMDPMPNICKVYSLLVQQERQTSLPIDESKVLATRSLGHQNYGNRDSQSKKTSNNHGRGSTRGGRSYGGRVPDKSDDQPSDNSEGNAQISQGLAFTPEQHKALLALLHDTSQYQAHNVNHLTSNYVLGSGIVCAFPNSFHPETFILDTGATDHVCFTKSYFQSLNPIQLITIKLPNGNLISTNLSGTIKFFESFYITNVLYMPNFAFNLISAPKLTNTLNCQLMFTNSDCVIHDLLSKKMIGTT
ncbi:uncharacterized protein LOC131658455 [Vicia villosa]|uniref:uncharacterized protein LOC131658455 n=1 Tax=Vicia villosa TaxID=3911 RepID=UPI00273BFF89|nr:uncharacterized protein LOC131658455 [Vicia villosa]